LSWQEINQMIKRIRDVLKYYPNALILIDVRVFYGKTTPTTEHWDMEVDEEFGENRLRIGVTREAP